MEKYIIDNLYIHDNMPWLELNYKVCVTLCLTLRPSVVVLVRHYLQAVEVDMNHQL